MGYVLLDILGTTLSDEDQEIIAHPAVCGVILFSRNYEHPKQLQQLTHNIVVANPNVTIVVDQEGGRVQRFKEHFTALPSMREWGDRFQQHPQQTLRELAQCITVMATELRQVGIHATLVPVLDVDYGVSDIIGERSFSTQPGIINQLAQVVIDTLHTCDMPVTGKHFPGHGAVTLDSHLALPVDSRPLAEILAKDLIPYQFFSQQLDAIMPAHIIYDAVDAQPAGFSRKWLQTILRTQLGFQGLIISDDLTMKAAEPFGDYIERARLAWSAGCDVITVCNNRAAAVTILDDISDRQSTIVTQRVQRFIGYKHQFALQ